MRDERLEMENLQGMVFSAVKVGEDRREVLFTLEDGRQILMAHNQDCCEDVYLEDVCGELEDLVGVEILIAYEGSSRDFPPPGDRGGYEGSHTWTFYRMSTQKGTVSFRWYGESNGYYSEDVNLRWIGRED